VPPWRLGEHETVHQDLQLGHRNVRPWDAAKLIDGRRTRCARSLNELIADPDREKSQRVMKAMLSMKKIEIDELERAAAQL
jgi:hypothetical protein